MKKEEFEKFFKIHSQNVDNSSNLGFWKLTDKIIEHFLLDNMKKRKNVTIVDFGGGTGRWLAMLDGYFKDSNFIIVDLSEDMLKQAQDKIKSKVFKNNVKLINENIENVKSLNNDIADYVISTYNPLSFVETPQNVIDEAFRILKPSGSAMISVQGYSNAIFSKTNNSLCSSEELLGIYKDRRVKWNPYVPELWQLDKYDMEKMFANSGFVSLSSKGIACVTQPQQEDFDPENKQLGKLSAKLNSDNKFFNTLLKIEIDLGNDPTYTNRGMNIMTIGVKP